MSHRGLYKLAGRCALCYACLSLAGYAAWIYASGFVAATSTAPSPGRLLGLRLATIWCLPEQEPEVAGESDESVAAPGQSRLGKIRRGRETRPLLGKS